MILKLDRLRVAPSGANDMRCKEVIGLDAFAGQASGCDDDRCDAGERWQYPTEAHAEEMLS